MKQFLTRLNDDELEFYVGFTLDGVEQYHNLSETMPEFGTISVFRDPEIHSFEEKDLIRIHRPYWPYQHNIVEIEVCTVAVSQDECFAVQTIFSFIS